MKRLSILILLFAWLLPARAHAQSNPPFQNPSLDSDCYFPQIGVPGEIDTIVGNTGQAIGEYIHNLGLKPDGSLGNLLLGDLSANPYSIAPTGPNFDLHNLHALAQTIHADYNDFRFGHFHDRSHLDIFDFLRIYWADDNGNYDSARYTDLKSNIGRPDLGAFDGPYIAHLASDTIDDIVMSFTSDSNYLDYFKGGANLFSKKVAYEDTSMLIPPPYGYQTFHATIQGDFRGTGRDDLLIIDYYDNLFFYRNDPPFSLDKLIHAMQYDTLWVTPPQLDSSYFHQLFNQRLIMHALPKAKGDSSYDFLVWIPTVHDTNNGIFIFRGGSDFGSHRITIDSAAYVITKPQFGFSWPYFLMNAGDMTGTGNDVLLTAGGGTGYLDLNFYVTGQALDSKIDAYYSDTKTSPGDTLTANSDALEDCLLSFGFGDGTIWLMYGSNKIPVHLNPQFADVRNIPQQDAVGIIFSPNPVTCGWSVATVVWPEAENAEYSIYDMLGRLVEHGPIRLLGGAEEQRIYFSSLPAGTYLFSIVGARQTASAKIVKLGGMDGASSPQPSFIQQLKQARDEPEVSNESGLQVR